MYLVYQHRNPNNNEIFYIGSGSVDRPHQLGKVQRGALYNLYIQNNDLVSYIGLYREVNVVVEILSTHPTKELALQEEHKLIQANYGKDGYKLVNTVSKFVYNVDMIQNRSKKVSEARSRKVINLSTNVVYKSITQMSNQCGIERTALQHRIKKVTSGIRYSDGVNPSYEVA